MAGGMLVEVVRLGVRAFRSPPHVSALISDVLYVVSLIHLAHNILHFSPRLASQALEEKLVSREYYLMLT